MKTEEGRLKDQVKAVLKQIKAYSYMPVPAGYGKQTVDFLVCAPCKINGARVGRFLAIETKAPGKTPTPRQELCLREVAAAGGVGIWCDNYDSFIMNMTLFGFLEPKNER